MVFRTKDGYITCGAVQQKEWEGLCAALDKPEWLTNERFATGAARNENRDERLRMTEEALMTMTMAEATQRLNEQQVPNGGSGPVCVQLGRLFVWFAYAVTARSRGAQPIHHRGFPHAMDAQAHQIVHQIVFRGDTVEHAAHHARLLVLGDLAEAERLQREVLEVRERLFGPAAPRSPSNTAKSSRDRRPS